MLNIVFIVLLLVLIYAGFRLAQSLIPGIARISEDEKMLLCKTGVTLGVCVVPVLLITILWLLVK